MSIVLYKRGNKNLVDGLECEIVLIENTDDMESLLDDGHVLNVQDLYSNDDDQESEDEDKINPVRLAARDHGIENWQTARIKTLQAALDEKFKG